MTETTAFLADDRLQYAPIQFVVASTMIYISVVVCMFSIVLLARAYKKESQARGIRRMSLFVFWLVIMFVGGWGLYTGLSRVSPPTPIWSLLITAGLFIGLLAHGLITYLDNRRFAEEKRFEPGRRYLRDTLKIVVATTLFVVALFVVSLHREGAFFRGVVTTVFAFAIMFSMVRFVVSAHLLVGEPKDSEERPSGSPETHNEAVLHEAEAVETKGKTMSAYNLSERTPKILILSSDTGGGHRSAAAAIVAGIQSFVQGESYAIRTIRAVEEAHRITARLVGIYNWVLRNKQHWMKYLYWAINRFRPETREFFYKRTVGYVASQFEKWCPHVVVSVHPLTQHMFARVLKELGLAHRIPLVTVVTDPFYGFWKGWACDDVSLYLVATDEARQQLIDYGIEPVRIKISGMPVHPKFDFPGEHAAQSARTALGLDPDKFTVFVNAGWEGGGNIPNIFRELVHGELDVQAIFLAGKNEELRGEAELIASEAKFPVKVIGYSEEVENLMRAANVMISKLGGLTTFEALTCRVPIIADATTSPMPQEASTAEMVVRRGAAVTLRKASDVVPVIRRMIDDSKHYAALRAATITLALPNATRRIVEEIVSLIPEQTGATSDVTQQAA
jgi:UDP-N-acetylglucosamine:LPS N-acetylglucosamine transferase